MIVSEALSNTQEIPLRWGANFLWNSTELISKNLVTADAIVKY